MHGSLLESASPVQSIRKHDNRRRRRLKGAFSRLRRPWRVVPRARSSGSGSIPRAQCQTTNARPQWMMILKMSSGIRTGIRSTYGRSPQLVRAALSLIIVITRGPTGWPWFWEEGSWRGSRWHYRTGLSNWEDTRGSSSMSNWQGWCLAASRSARPSSFPVAPGFSSSSRCCSGDRRGAGRGEGAEG